MNNLKTFEGFLDFFKSAPKPAAPFTPLSDDIIRERVQRLFQPLATDSDFVMNVVQHGTFHLKGSIDGAMYSVGIFKTPFFAGREEAPAIKATIGRNIRQFEFFVADEDPSEERQTAESFMQGRVDKIVSRIMRDPELQQHLESNGQIITNGLVELGFKFSFLVRKASSPETLLGTL